MCNDAQAYVAEQASVIWLFTGPTFYDVSKRHLQGFAQRLRDIPNHRPGLLHGGSQLFF
jgi:hypothetical protein